MFNRILIATDGSELADLAVRTGLDLAKELNAHVIVMTATDPWAFIMGTEASTFDFSIKEYEQAQAKHAQKILSKASREALNIGVSYETLHVQNSAAEGILAAATDKACGLVIMASHGRRGLSRLLLGSQATRVMTFSKVPVLICRTSEIPKVPVQGELASAS